MSDITTLVNFYLVLNYCTCIIAERTMYNIFTTGYSNKIIWYNVDEANSKVTFQGDSEIEPNLSFGAVDEVNNGIYFAHEVGNYKNFTNSGVVSRFTIASERKTDANIPNLSIQEVHKYFVINQEKNGTSYLLRDTPGPIPKVKFVCF